MIHKILGRNVGNQYFLCNKQSTPRENGSIERLKGMELTGHRRWNKVTCKKCLRIQTKLPIVDQYDYRKYWK